MSKSQSRTLARLDTPKRIFTVQGFRGLGLRVSSSKPKLKGGSLVTWGSSAAGGDSEAVRAQLAQGAAREAVETMFSLPYGQTFEGLQAFQTNPKA